MFSSAPSESLWNDRNKTKQKQTKKKTTQNQLERMHQDLIFYFPVCILSSLLPIPCDIKKKSLSCDNILPTDIGVTLYKEF